MTFLHQSLVDWLTVKGLLTFGLTNKNNHLKQAWLLCRLITHAERALSLCTALVNKLLGWGTDLPKPMRARKHAHTDICVSRHQGAFLTNWQEPQGNTFCLPPLHHTDPRAHQPNSAHSMFPATTPVPAYPYSPRTRAALGLQTGRG